MKIALSIPAGRPAWARPVLDRVFAFVRNCRSDPCPVSFLFTTVEKLNPKSTQRTDTALMILTGAFDWAKKLPRFWLVVFAGASWRAGSAPPTSFVTATAVPEPASVRNVWTGHSPGTYPVREEVTVLSTTRTV